METNTPTRNQWIAEEILRQMGGTGRLKIMLGAKDFCAIDNGLRFRMPSNFAKDGINLVEIVLTPMDEYNLIFSRLRAGKVKEITRFEGVYCDQLHRLFRDATGLATRL
jgi:hypothetical protein